MLNKGISLLSIIFIVSFIIRFFFFNTFLRDNPVQISFDSGHYHMIATQLVQGNGYVATNGLPYFYRLPGYPFFLTACYKFFGSPYGALIAQIILASIIPALAYALSVMLIPAYQSVAIGASLLCMLHPGFLIFSGLVMSDTLFTILFLFFFVFFLRSKNSSGGRMQQLFFSGFFLGCASLVRPGGGAFLILALLLLGMMKSCFLIRKLGYFLSGWLLVTAPWLLRNFILTGSVFFSTLSGPHMINHGAVRVIMAAERCSWQHAREKIIADIDTLKQKEVMIKGRQLHEIEASNIAEAYAHKIFFKYPFQTIRLCIINMLKTIFSLYSSELLFIDSRGTLPEYSSDRSPYDMFMRFIKPDVNNQLIAWVIYLEIILNLFILIGFFGFSIYFCYFLLMREAQFTDIFFFFAMFAFILLVITLSSICGFARLRLPIEPFFIMLSMSFWRKILSKERVV